MSNYKRTEGHKTDNYNGGIYCITNLKNDKKYIGQTYDLKYRWMRHKSDLNCGRHHNKHLQSAWNKYGENNFSYSILEYCPIEILDDKEIYWIEFYNVLNSKCGYNLADGGLGCRGYKHTEEEILKMRMIQNPEPIVQLDLKGNYINTFISAGEASDSLGKESIAGIKRCCEKDKYRQAYGYIWVYEKDYKNNTIDWDYYFTEAKNKKKPVLQYDADMNFIREWDSVSQTKEGGFIPSQVSSVCNGKSINHRGYIFIYKDKPDLYYKEKGIRNQENLKRKLEKQKKILQFTKDDQFIREYTYQELVDDGFKLRAVQACCCGHSKSSQGYHWKYSGSTTLLGDSAFSMD